MFDSIKEKDILRRPYVTWDKGKKKNNSNNATIWKCNFIGF